jgi:membrane protein implicated in regulation of membrane protease activity
LFPDRANANVIPILTALVVGYFFLDPPWRWLILIPAAAIDVIDIIVWLRWRKRRAVTGAESLVGSTATVVTVERPGEATVKARGQLWNAAVRGNVHAHDRVVIRAVDGIRLQVEPEHDDAIERPIAGG